MRKNILYTVLTLAIAATAAVYVVSHSYEAAAPAAVPSPKSTVIRSSDFNVLPAPPPPSHAKSTANPVSIPRAATSTSVPAPAIRADAQLVVGTTTYPISLSGKESVMDAMRSLALRTDLRFATRTFPGMGEFVESINGTANADGFYWILIVNGKKSDFGASSVFISPGDRIEWSYERGY